MSKTKKNSLTKHLNLFICFVGTVVELVVDLQHTLRSQNRVYEKIMCENLDKRKFPFLKEVPSQPLQEVFVRLQKAFENFFRKDAKYPKSFKVGQKFAFVSTDAKTKEAFDQGNIEIFTDGGEGNLNTSNAARIASGNSYTCSFTEYLERINETTNSKVMIKSKSL